MFELQREVSVAYLHTLMFNSGLVAKESIWCQLFLDETGKYTVSVLRNNFFEIGLQDNNYSN